MFTKEYSFKGSHAEMVRKLTAEFDENGNKLFDRNLDVYMLAPIIGFLYGRKAEINKDPLSPTKIFPQQLIDNSIDLMLNYRLIILLDKNNEPDAEKRVDKVFRDYGSEKAISDEELFEMYVRGGVDVLYEKLINNIKNTNEYVTRLYDFMEEFDERYNQMIDMTEVLSLCKKIKI